MAKRKTKKKVAGTIAYTGDIQIDYAHGKKIYKTVKAHNTGRVPLFSFIANCIAGTFNPGENPKYIRLFHVNNKDEEGTFTDEKSVAPVPFSTVAVEEYGDNAKTIFKFTIPFSLLPVVSPDRKAQEGINQIAIYNSTNYNTKTNPSAYFVIHTPGSTETYAYLDSDGKSNVIITWTMTFKNAIAAQ